MLGKNEAPGAWFPMWSHSNNYTTDSEAGMAWAKIGEVKHEYLPKVVMADDFDSAWKEYMGKYKDCKPEDFLNDLQEEANRRMKEAEKYK